MEKQILTLLFLGFCLLTFSQNKKSIYPNFIGQNLKAIKNNSDWKILQESTGDLNNDGFNDFALILESKDSILEKRCTKCKILKNKPRIIVVLLNQGDSRKVIIQNNKFIARADEGGMLPYLEPELLIENGLLKIYYQYTRSNQLYIFKYKNNQMEIIQAESNSVHAATGNFENNKFDFLKGEIVSESGNISQENINIEVLNIEIKPKILSEFEEMYDWKITEHKYL